MAKIGQIIGGRYKVVKLLEKGGMSMIYLAEDTHISKLWVIKETPKIRNGRENTLPVCAAEKEAKILKELDHPGIVRIVDYFEDSVSVYIIEDYVNGISLKEYVDKEKEITECDFLILVKQICDILICLHSEENAVIYRDLKPENIIVYGNQKVRLVDFGIARTFKNEKKSDTEYLGTEKYAAPEQYEKFKRQTDKRTDIYGLGGVMEFLADNCRIVSPEIRKIIKKCMEHNPEERYQTVEELSGELEKITGRPPDIRKRDVSIGRILLCVGAVVCVVLALCTIMLRSSRKTDVIQKVNTLIQVIKEDETFSKEEEEKLINVIMPEFKVIREREGFEELAYNIGKLYWFYYDYGVDSLAGMMAALPWFTLSKNYNQLSASYLKIGNFYRNIQTISRESEDDGVYLQLFRDLSELVKIVAPASEAELIKFEIYQLAINTMETYVRKFKADKVGKDELLWLCQSIKDNTADLEATSKQADEIKAEIMKKTDDVEKAINDIYGG